MPAFITDFGSCGEVCAKDSVSDNVGPECPTSHSGVAIGSAEIFMTTNINPGVDIPSPYFGRQRSSVISAHNRTPGVNAIYKPKSRKVRPVDSDKSDGQTPGGYHDWYERSRVRDTPQKQSGVYQRYLLPRIANFERGKRLTDDRIQQLDIGTDISEAERALLLEILYNREGVIAGDWTECGVIHSDVEPPVIIRTRPHKAWQCRTIRIPAALQSVSCQMWRDRKMRGVLEDCLGPYRNPWFLVGKTKPGTYRLICCCTTLNGNTIRDAFLPPSVDEFSEIFSGCAVASLVDLFSGYDQVVLDERCRDMTAFMTPEGLLRCTRLPQGATNSVGQFCRIMRKIIGPLEPNIACAFLDDIGIRGPESHYDDEEILPGIRRFIFEHLLNLDKTLERLERAGASIGLKSQFCKSGLNVVGFVTDSDGRHPDSRKVEKILKWRDCKDVKEARSFLGVMVYYRIWIYGFSIIAEPIYRLLKKGAEWHWGDMQRDAMVSLKAAITSAPALVKLCYDNDAGQIVLTVDASLQGWGADLGQLDAEGKRHPARFESGLWSTTEKNYDATKRECKGVVYALKKLRHWLVGVHFVLETDANVLVAQINKGSVDHPGALITRWLAWINMFDFEVRHIPGKGNLVADALSRRPPTDTDVDENEMKSDIDDWILGELNALSISPVSTAESSSDFPNDGQADVQPLIGEYSLESQLIAKFLTTLKRPCIMSDAAFRAFRKRALKFAVRDGYLWRKATKVNPPRRVVDSPALRIEILKSAHDNLGHKGRESTYHQIMRNFWWERCYVDCRKFVASCLECQTRTTANLEEALFPTFTGSLFTNLAIDITFMPRTKTGLKYLVLARCDLSNWVEGRAIRNPTAAAVAKFIWEDIICRHGLFGKLVVDGGTEFMGEVVLLLQKYDVNRVQISAYNKRANGMVERGHKPIVQALARMCGDSKDDWNRYLHAVLFADRVTVHAPTGRTPFSLVYGREAVLPLEGRFTSWRVLEWSKVKSRSELLAVRARQLEVRDNDLSESVLRKRRLRQERAEAWNDSHRLRTKPFLQGDVVLKRDSRRQGDMTLTEKLTRKWLGPFRIASANTEKGYYTLEELDGTRLAGTVAANRLKNFVSRDDYLCSASSDQPTHESTPSESTAASSSEYRTSGN
ncbi:hypothetical protein K3495_g10672, partial [Podosphaera aphanis]